jgi:hypothetical protein
MGASTLTAAKSWLGPVADCAALNPAIYAIAAVGMASAFILGFFVPETLKQQPAPAPVRF